MKLFECQQCGQQLYFENTRCENCGAALGFIPDQARLTALADLGHGRWQPIGAGSSAAWRFCANAGRAACNWLLPADRQGEFCTACRLNRTIPDLSVEENLELWQRVEQAKHRLIYGLLRLGLPLESKAEEGAGLAFDILADVADPSGESDKVMTGHADGLITIRLAEADAVVRERARQDMGESYRTLLGHFRHEVAHYYWERLVRGGSWLEPFRSRFGDDRQDYGDALARHHADGPPTDWQQRFVSAYASAHPWEDFAETWAHYMHMTDTLETAFAFRLRVAPAAGVDPALGAEVDFDPYREPEFDELLKDWLPVTYALNSLNESMGLPKLYPFLLPPAAIEKVRFVHDLVRSAGSAR